MDITQSGGRSEQSDLPKQPAPGLPKTTGYLRRPLRLWPAVIATVILVLARLVVPYIFPPAAGFALLTSFIAALLIAIWWLFFSRAPWIERIGAIVLMVIAIIATKRGVHPSIAGGAMGFLLYVLAIPVFALALVSWAAATRNLSNLVRRVTLLGTILLVCVGFLFLRTGGITAEFDNDFHWRWSKTPEELLLTQAEETAPSPAPAIATVTSSEWSGFRGPERDGTVRGTKIKTDWSTSPPVEMWRRPIGPAWSSFAIIGDRFYTQEQRGNEEIVACYELKTGKAIWKHSDSARFWESNGGPGPRGTPTISNGRVYTLGATGILNVLDANNGKVVWSKNAASDTGSKLPVWGYSGSPLVLDDRVIVATSGSLIAYDAGSGERRWVVPSEGVSYSSPHLAKIGGVAQVIMLNYQGVISVSPTDGQRLWSFSQPPNARIVQPALTSEGDVLTHDGESTGLRRLAVAHGPNGWTAQEKWFSEGLNPYFSDFVVHKGHAYGFEGSSIASIELQGGNRKWKGGQYGHGQLVLLADQDLLVVITEDGQLVLVKATPDQFTELGRIRAIKGKTWNHPVVAGDVVLVRNGEEMAAFKLPAA